MLQISQFRGIINHYMAKINISPEEIINVLTANELLGGTKLDVEGREEDISIRIKISLISVGVILKLLAYKDDVAEFEIKTNKLVENELFKKLKGMKLDGKIIWLDPPRIFININTLLRMKVKGIRIENFYYKNGLFNIITQAS